MSRGSRLLLPVGVCAVLALAGCASIPTSGPVRSGGDLRLQRADDGVSVIGEPPRPGATPSQIVNGFLDSSADFQNDHEVARLYLTTAASRAWRPQAGTQVYDKTELSVEQSSADASTFVFDAPAVGDIAGDGTYSRAEVGPPVIRQFRLAKVNGQWRIADLDDGLLLSSSELGDTYRQVSLYFLAPSGVTLVPDPVLIPELPGLSTKVVARLLRGPTSALRGAVTTAFPEGTSLDVSSVPVTDGVATVQLDDTALRADDTARQQMSAQLVWTLKQLSGVTAIRIRVGGEDLQVNSAGAVQQSTDWPTFDPDKVPSNLSAYVELDGRVGRYLEGKFSPVLGEGGLARPRVRTPAVSFDNARLAAVSAPAGHSVLVGRMQDGEKLAPRIGGPDSDFSSPSWDRDNGLWVVDRTDGRAVVPRGRRHHAAAGRGALERRPAGPWRPGLAGRRPGGAAGRHRPAGPVHAGRRPPGGDRRPPGGGGRAAVARVGDGAVAGPARGPGHGVGRRDARRGAGQPGERVAAAVRGERGRVALPRHRARAGTG